MDGHQDRYREGQGVNYLAVALQMIAILLVLMLCTTGLFVGVALTTLGEMFK